ncbi:MAG: hypothetical protein K5744_05930 [Eubacterium sp.]|nr:hypothetical protein [Eubacterium sp.]
MANLPKIALGAWAWAIAKGTLPIIGVTKENQVLDAVKAANVALTAEETAELERVADSLELNVIRFWEKGVQINRPDEDKIRKMLDTAL